MSQLCAATWKLSTNTLYVHLNSVRYPLGESYTNSLNKTHLADNCLRSQNKTVSTSSTSVLSFINEGFISEKKRLTSLIP